MGPLRQGNNETIQYSVVAGSGLLQNVTSWSFLFRVKDPGQSGFVISKSSTDPTQIAIVNPVQGKVEVYLLPADSNPLDATLTYEYDFQGTDTVGNVYTLDSGDLTFTPILTA